MPKKSLCTDAKPSRLAPTDRIVAAGRKLFFEHGFESISTDVLASEASVSKATLYKYFPNLIAVLTAVVQKEAEAFEQGVSEARESEAAFRVSLINYGANLLRFLNAPDAIRFTQLIFEEARANPDLASEFYSSAFESSISRASELIQRGIEGGYVKGASASADPKELAEQFIGMLKGVRFDKAHLGLTKRPFPDPRGWSEKCVARMFG